MKNSFVKAKTLFTLSNLLTRGKTCNNFEDLHDTLKANKNWFF